MNTKLATRQIRLNKWAGIIKAHKASGLTVDEYCKQHNISRSAYFYWLRRIKEEALSQAGFVEIPPVNAVAEKSFFDTQMIIKSGATEICINNNTPSDLITRVLEVLGHA